MTAWGEEYVNLVLRVEKHFEGFVDAYFGPQEVKARISKEEKNPLDDLYQEAEHLYETVPHKDTPRRIFLEKQMTAIMTTIRVLQGEEIDYTKQVELFFDIKPEKIPDSEFERPKQVLQDIFKGENLNEAIEKWCKAKEVPLEVLQECIGLLCGECQKRTGKMLSLPEGEHVDFVLVENKPWSGYNWYLGDYTSRVEVNTDFPLTISRLPLLVTHEAYPGHHTEKAVKEKVLYRSKGFFEACVFVYNTPRCLISEGIGDAGLEMIFRNRKEVLEFLNERMGFHIDVDINAAISEALDELFPCCGNASLMFHEENADRADVVEYMIDVGLSTKERAEKLVEFVTNPLFKAYMFTYILGEKLVRNALRKVPPEIFYENQVCPSNLKYLRK